MLRPNAIEAAALTGKQIETLSDLITAGYALLDLGERAVLLKGGHPARWERVYRRATSKKAVWALIFLFPSVLGRVMTMAPDVYWQLP